MQCRTFDAAVRRLLGGRSVILLRTIVGALLLLVVLTPASAQREPTGADGGRHLRADGHVALAWLYGGSSNDYRNQIEAARGLSVISPTWWYLDTDDPGGVTFATDDSLTAFAHERDIAVWPLFGNHIDPDLTDQVLRDEELRARMVAEVVAETRRSGVDGVNVDFENLHDDTAVLLTQLIIDLKAALPDLIISVDVTAMTDTWVLGNWSTAFDRAGLGVHADYVMLMAYDQHNSLRRDGPVAGLRWVAESSEFLLRTVPAEKVVLGLPFYSRDWAEDPDATDGIALDSTLGMAGMANRMAERSEQVIYDEVAGQDLHIYSDASGRPHRVWLEDVASLTRKTELVALHDLAGVAAWRAGFEPPEVWDALDAQLAAIPPPGSQAAAAEAAAQAQAAEEAAALAAATQEIAAADAGSGDAGDDLPQDAQDVDAGAGDEADVDGVAAEVNAFVNEPQSDKTLLLIVAVALLGSVLVGHTALASLRTGRGRRRRGQPPDA